MTLNLGDFAEAVALFGFGDLLLGFLQQGRLVAGNAQVVNAPTSNERIGSVL